MTTQEMSHEALTRATSSQSVMNYATIFAGFAAMGIPESEIKPRENVLTFWAWKAVGRRVMKGQHGVKACTFVPVGGKLDEETGERKPGFRMPRTTTVFHISQTELDDQAALAFGGHEEITTHEYAKPEPKPRLNGPCKVCGFGILTNGICGFCG